MILEPLKIPIDKMNPIYWYVVGGVVAELIESGVLDTETGIKAFGHFERLSVEAGERAFSMVHGGMDANKIDNQRKQP